MLISPFPTEFAKLAQTTARLMDPPRKLTRALGAILKPSRECTIVVTAPYQAFARFFEPARDITAAVTAPCQALARVFEPAPAPTTGHHRAVDGSAASVILRDGLQAAYHCWVANRSGPPTRADDRVWARARGISQRRVARLRHKCPLTRHQRGRPRK